MFIDPTFHYFSTFRPGRCVAGSILKESFYTFIWIHTSRTQLQKLQVYLKGALIKEENAKKNNIVPLILSYYQSIHTIRPWERHAHGWDNKSVFVPKEKGNRDGSDEYNLTGNAIIRKFLSLWDSAIWFISENYKT